jgi:hypothetical protein
MQVVVSGDFSGEQYVFSGSDLWTAYGYMVETGGNDLLQLYKSKEVYAKDWKGQNGKQYDLTKRFFEDKIATLSGVLVADDEDDFWEKYLALWEVLKSPGAKTLYSNDLKQTFSVFYLDSPNSKKLTPLSDYPGKIGMRLDIQFQVMFMEFEPPTSGPRPPIVYAGGNRSIVLPTSSVTISGATITPRSGSTISYKVWQFVSGPSLPVITNEETLTPTISALTTTGAYVFRLYAEDSNALNANNTMTITVLPEGSTPTGFPYTFPYNLS